MDKNLIFSLKSKFDEIVHQLEDSTEYWYARELQIVFGYAKWDKFHKVVMKAMLACQNSGVEIDDHFLYVGKMVPIGSGAEREIEDIMLSRYAAYLVAMSGDSSKNEIAFAQSYFAVQTRKQEIIEERLELIHRLQLRGQLRDAEKRLSQNIYDRGVDDAGFGRIRSKGDQALFGGYSTRDMKERYSITSGALADRLPSVTIAAKGLATEMTNLNIEQKDLHGEFSITTEHVQNNASVRKMLGERGIKPEELPPAEDIKKLERRVRSEEKKLSESEALIR